MQNRKNQSAAGKLMWEMACRQLEKTLPEEVMKKWVNRLEIENFDSGQITFSYNGKREEQYEETYKAALEDSLEWAAGHKVSVGFSSKGSSASPKGKKARRRRTGGGAAKGFLVAAVAIVLCGAAVLGSNLHVNQTFRENFYGASSGKVENGLRILQLSDLHNTSYGENNSELIRRAQLLEPDLIVMTGDMIEQSDAGTDVALDLCKNLTEIAPVYFIYGNNEETRFMNLEGMGNKEAEALFLTEDQDEKIEKFKELDGGFRELLEAAGVHVLWNEMETAEIDGVLVDIFGTLTGDVNKFWTYVGPEYDSFLNENKDHFKLLLSHEPYIFESYGAGGWADLALCGQTHGGVVRLPGVGGLYEHENGFLPELQGAYVYGQYDLGECSLIVSSGLTNRGVVRINNQPELVVVDVMRY